MKSKLLLFSLAVFSLSVKSQVVEFDSEAIGKDFVFNLNLYSDAFISPIMESYSASQISSNQTSARVLKPFAFGIGVTGSFTFVEEDKLNFDFNTIGFTDKLTLADPNDPILPTSLGGFTTKTLLYEVEGTTLGGTSTFSTQEQLSAFDGIKTPMNSIPSGALTFQIGLPLNTEIYFKALPTVDFEDVTNYSIGGGLKHMISQYFLKEESDVHFAVSGFYGSTNFTFLPNEFLDGNDQKISFTNKTTSFEFIASLDKKFFSMFGLIGHYSGNSEFDIAGTYIYNAETQGSSAVSQEAFVVTDPVSLVKETSGIHASFGASFKIKEIMSLTAAYHVANNNSIGLNLRFFILNGED